MVATFRRDRELRNALDSLVGQTYSPLEVIVVDDNADPEWNAAVRAAIEAVQPSVPGSIVCLRNAIHSGSAGTRNAGIAAATGEYVTFLDDDDVYLPQKVERQVAHMIGERADFCITDLQLFSESGRLVENRRRDYIVSDQPATLLTYHLMYHMTGTDTLMFRRDYLLKLGGFPSVDLGDEFYLMRDAIAAGGRFSYLPACDVRACVHSAIGGMSSGQTKIDGENVLYADKQSYFSQLDNKTIAYINMRHWAVLAYAELRRRRFLRGMRYAMKSFASSPAQCMSLLLRVG